MFDITDKSFDVCVHGQQVFGGHGYIEEWGMSQYARDARIAMIYEGTNGIQALDLIGRKLQTDNGALFNEFFTMIDNYQVKISNNQDMKKYIDLFMPSYDSYKSIFEYIKSLNDENEINSHAVEFLNLSSLISLGYIWLHYIEISLAKLEKHDESFYKSKIETGNFFLTKLLGETQVLCQNIRSGGKYYNDYNDKYFETAI